MTTDPTVTGAPEPVVIVVMGVTGTGKSTVAGILAGQLRWDLKEGDDLHPPGNVAKMAAGHPLDDDDRWPWLDTIASWIDGRIRTGSQAIITCSALKRAYRDRLARPGVSFVHLTGTEEEIFHRLSARLNHFMPASLLQSQLQTLEPLQDDETGIVVTIGQEPETEVETIRRTLHLQPHASPESPD